MPLVLCPNCNEGMKEVERHGVRIDICPTCRGVWLDRGELEKPLAAAREAAAEEDAAMPEPPRPAPSAQPTPMQGPPPGWQQPAPPPQSGWHQQPPPAYGHPYPRRKKKRFFDDLFDIFD